MRAARVVLVAPFGLRPKGTTIARVLPIGRMLVRQGASVRLIIPPWDDRRRAEQRWWEDGVEIVHTTLSRGPIEPLQITAEVWRLMREHNPSVVHVFKPIGYSGLVASLLGVTRSEQCGIRLVVDADDLEGPSGWAGRHSNPLSGGLRGVQERFALRRANRVTVASHWLGEYVAALGVPRTRVRYVPNGQDEATESDQADEGVELATTPTLLWYTRFTEASPERATALLSPLLRAASERRLAIVGEEIAEGARTTLARFLREAGVADQVDWLGYDPEGVARYVSRRRGNVVAVYPMDDDRVNRARCPSKVPQLMALGVPLVAEAVGEIPYYLSGFESDALVPPGSADRFQELAERLLTDSARRAAVGRHLRDASARWRWEQTAAGLLDWYLDRNERT